ncbi:MAG: hypothetical protein JO117_11335, partial [Verrucomicrobia bacterium]|nr:hypothetical protein [Verrucomicrobiota bacterium]
MPRSLRLLAAFVFTASFALPFAGEAKPATTPAAAPKVPTDDAVRLQVFLDRENFGPGKIDGSYGG